MSSESLPTILIIPGAFHPPSCFDAFVPHLQKEGYSTIVVPLPSSNPSSPSTASCSLDADSIRENFLIPLIEEKHEDVVLFAHSYGGIPGGAASKGFGKVTRMSQGKRGGIIGLIYLNGNINKNGESLLDTVGGQYPPFIKIDTPLSGLAMIEPAIPTLYADVAEPLASALAESMLPHSLLAFTSPTTAPAWAESAFEGRRAYIRCTEDSCLPFDLQNAWLESCGVEWAIRDLEASHSAYISQPEAVAGLVSTFARQWAAPERDM